MDVRLSIFVITKSGPANKLLESVEELCDHIALIDKSEKILDGKLIDIKREYRSNTFEVALETANNIHYTSGSVVLLIRLRGNTGISNTIL